MESDDPSTDVDPEDEGDEEEYDDEYAREDVEIRGTVTLDIHDAEVGSSSE